MHAGGGSIQVPMHALWLSEEARIGGKKKIYVTNSMELSRVSQRFVERDGSSLC
jgi:hypothetical protein